MTMKKSRAVGDALVRRESRHVAMDSIGEVLDDLVHTNDEISESLKRDPRDSGTLVEIDVIGRCGGNGERSRAKCLMIERYRVGKHQVLRVNDTSRPSACTYIPRSAKAARTVTKILSICWTNGIPVPMKRVA